MFNTLGSNGVNMRAIAQGSSERNISAVIEEKDVKKALRARNKLDKQRKISPLLKHRNSIIVNSQKLNKKEMVEKMSKYIEKVMNI